MRRAIVLVASLAAAACSSTDTTETAATSVEAPATASTTATDDEPTTLPVDDLRTAKSVSYSTTSRKELDVYSPADQEPWPVVVVVHGVFQASVTLVGNSAGATTGMIVALAGDDLWSAVDPYSHLGGNGDLVVRLIHGDDADQAWYEIPRAVSVEFHQALADAGYDAEITLIDRASHTVANYP